MVHPLKLNSKTFREQNVINSKKIHFIKYIIFFQNQTYYNPAATNIDKTNPRGKTSTSKQIVFFKKYYWWIFLRYNKSVVSIHLYFNYSVSNFVEVKAICLELTL